MCPNPRGADGTPHDAEPSGVLDLIGHDPAEPLDENLHFGRAWHRYGYCYRRADPLRVLDAGCGTGRSSDAVVRLNAGAEVLGVDASADAVGVARDRARDAGLTRVRFAVHDLEVAPPGEWGSFDFVICRKVLGHAADPARLLRNLAACLDPRGLVLVTLPSRDGRRRARALRLAIDALAPAGAGLEERARIGVELLQTLRPDHPIRTHLAGVRALPHGAGPAAVPGGLARAVLDALLGDREWTLAEAEGLLEQADLRMLYVAGPGFRTSDLGFDRERMSGPLRARLESADPAQQSRLADALEPPDPGDEYILYGCKTSHAPEVPKWTVARRNAPDAIDQVVPHLTGLGWPDTRVPVGPASHGRIPYRTVSGGVGELDRQSVLRLAAVNGQSSCGQIDRNLSSHTRVRNDTMAGQECWVALADSGLVLLEPPGSA